MASPSSALSTLCCTPGAARPVQVPGTSMAFVAEIDLVRHEGSLTREVTRQACCSFLVFSFHAGYFYPHKRGISPDPETLSLFFTFCYMDASCVQPCLFAPLVVASLKQNVWLCPRNVTKYLNPVLYYAGLGC